MKLNLDFLGLCLSGACMLYAMTSPVLPAGLLPAAEELFLQILWLGTIPVTVAAGTKKYLEVRDPMIIATLLSGVLVLVIAIYGKELLTGGIYHLILSLSGGVLLLTGHWMNYNDVEISTRNT